MNPVGRHPSCKGHSNAESAYPRAYVKSLSVVSIEGWWFSTLSDCPIQRL
jgi:hypothetical protein